MTSGVSDWAVLEICSDNSQLSGNYDPLRTACKTCSRNYTCRKCKPWRRKSLLNTTPKWTWFYILYSLNMLLLLASLYHTVLNGLCRTMSAKKTSRLRLHFLLLIACFLGGTLLPLASCQESLQSSPSVKSQLSNAVVFVGSAFSYNISTSVFDCEVDSIVVSETADRFLSHWLSYNSEKKQLYGVPSDKDEGTYNILVVALTKDNAVRGHVCGSRSFSIVVMPVSNELPVSVHFGTGSLRSYHKSSHSLSCLPGVQAVLGTVVLNADMQSLNGHERMVLLSKMADHLKIHTSKVSFFPGESSHPITQQLDNVAIMAAGVGDGRFAKGSRSLLTWNIGCGAFKLEDAAFSRLETDSQDGTISTLLGFPVVGWHVMSGAQKNLARRRVRRAVMGIGFTPTPTPTATSAPPTRMSNMSTSVVMSRTVTLTSSAGSINSTITLPVSASVTLSVAPNRTIVQSTDASINTTIFSQSLPRTIQSSTLIVNITVSSQSPNRTDIQSSSVSINVTSSPSFSKTVVQSSTVTNFSSPMTSFSQASILNSSILTGTSSTPVLSRNATQFVNRTSSLVTTPSLNLTFITRTASPSISLSVPFISSLSFPTTTRTRNSSIFVMSPNESATFVSSSSTVLSFSMTPLSNVTVLIPSTPQVNITEVTRTSQFAVSSNITLITSTSLLLSPSLAVTTFQPTSAMTISTSQLNSSTPNVTSPTLSTLPSPTVITSNSSVTVATTSVLVTASVNQTINSSPIFSATLTKTFSISPTLSMVTLVPNTTSVENVTSPFMTSGFVTSSLTLLSSTPHLESTMLLNRTLPMPVSTFLTTSFVPTMASTQRSTSVITSSVVPSLNFSSVTLSSSLIQPSSTLVSSSSSERLSVTHCTSVPTMTSTQKSTFAIASSLVPSLNFSSVTLSSSLIQPSSTLVSSSSSERLNVTSVSNMTSVVANITSATLQSSVTSAPSVNMLSLTASPLVTSANLTSVVITANTTDTKRTAVVNSTSISERSTFVTLTTSVFLPRKTSGTRTFPSTFITNRTVVVSTSGEVETSSVNISSAPKTTRTTFLLSSGSSLNTFQFSSVVPSSVLSRSFTKLPNTTFVTVSSSSEVRVNSTALSRTQERSSTLTSVVTRLGNSSLSPRRSFSSNTTQVMVSTQTVSSTAFVANSSSVVPSVSTSITNISSFLSPSSRSIFRSSTILLPNASSSVAVSKRSITFSSTVTSAESSLMNTSSLISRDITTPLKSTSLLTTAIFTRNRTVISTTQVSLTITTPLLNSSLVTSTLKSQSLTTAISTSGIVKSSEVLKNSTAVLSTIATVSPSSSSLVVSSSLVLASSSFGINSTLIRETPSVTVTPPTSATVLQTTVAVLLTSATRIPTSSPIQNTSSLTRTASPSIVSTLVLSTSTMQTEFSTPVDSTQSTRTFTRSTRVPHSSSRLVSVSSKLSSFVRSSVTVITTSRPQVNSTQSTRTLTRSTRVPHSSSRVVSVSSKLSSFVRSSVTVIPTSRPQVNRTTGILPTSGTPPSSSTLFSSNTTLSVTATDATQTVSVLSTSSVPVTAPPTSPPNLPPLLLNNIGRVRAPAGKALQFIIPDDTFYDREDRATTRDLTLSMTLANGSNIPTDFWLQFDIASQTINGLPLDEHVPDGILGQVLVLRARDNHSAETFDAFEVLVVPSETPVVQELKVRITNEFATFNLALKLALLKKIAAYYDDADESKIRVLTFSPGSVIMTWTNDSLPTDNCDEEKLQYVTNKMLLPNGEVREEFREALQGFPVVSASQERFGVCNGSFIAPTETPIDPARKEARVEEHLWYKHVLVGLLIVVIIVVLAALLIWYCRRRRPKPLKEKRTFKKRKPIVLGPEIELKPLPGKPLVLPDDDPSLPSSYISETSFNKPTYSDDEDEEDYGKRRPSVVYEPPPPFYPPQDDYPRNSPPPAYLMPPMY